MMRANTLFQTAAEFSAATAASAPPPPEPDALTWRQIARAEPRLAGLMREARAVRAEGAHFCANDVWYDLFKPRLLLLVGWEVRPRDDRPDWLRSRCAYDIAYDRVYAALPNCRDCLCV